jgi:hypothetical protein
MRRYGNCYKGNGGFPIGILRRGLGSVFIGSDEMGK